MGLIRNAASNISAYAHVQQSGDPTTVALRWLTYFKSGGMYHIDPSGTVLRVLTSADLSSLSGVYQPLDSDLTALAGLSSTGLIARTGSGTAAVRTITGTSNRIGVTNGDGVSGNPTLDIGTDVVTLTGSQTLTNKTLTTPTIASFANATHNHSNAAGGGTLAQANTHGSPDTDSSTTALHHTLGTGANQAAPGNHTHTGKSMAGSNVNSAVSAGATSYHALFTEGSLVSSETNARTVIPFDCTVKNLYLITTTAQGGGGTLVATIRRNSGATSIAVTVPAGAAAATFSDTSHSQAFSAGDTLDMQFVNNDGGSASAVIRTWVIELDTTI